MGRHPSKKKIIEAAAIRLFGRPGFASTSIKDIAFEAGVTDSALYKHYKSKNEMGWELYVREILAFSHGLYEIVKDIDPDSRYEVLKAGIEYAYKYAEAYPERFRFILLNQNTFPDGDLDEKHSNLIDMVIKAVAKGTDNFENHECLSAILWGALVQPLIMIDYGLLKKKPSECIDIVVEQCSKILNV